MSHHIDCPNCLQTHRLMSAPGAAGGLLVVPLVGRPGRFDPDPGPGRGWDLPALMDALDEVVWVHPVAVGVGDDGRPILQVAAGANSESEAPRRLRAVLGGEAHTIRYPDGSVTRVWSTATGIKVVLVL